MLVVPDVPGVLTAPGTYSVRAEKSSPFKGKFWMVFAVKVLLSVASFVLRMGAASETLTVVETVPGRELHIERGRL